MTMEAQADGPGMAALDAAGLAALLRRNAPRRPATIQGAKGSNQQRTCSACE